MEKDPHDLYMQIAQNLKALRAAYDNGKGISQAKLAKVFGLPQQSYAAYESGKNRIPLEMLSKIAAFYGVSVNSMLVASPTQSILLTKLNEECFTENEIAEIDNYIDFVKSKRSR